jgi:3'(2'), 5'-bisphosphate nucleotidase
MKAPMNADYHDLLEMADAAATDAGAEILRVYGDGFTVEQKVDASPVTLADRVAEALILDRLAAATPHIPIIAEEHAAAFGLPGMAPPRFWLVDPLDGTKEFIRRNGEFTVNIALVEGDCVVLGVVHVPVQGVTYAAAGPGSATRRRRGAAAEAIAARPLPPVSPVVVHSRSHADETELARYVAALPEAVRLVAGSSVKFCLLAAGEADLYPRFGRTMEWDTGAGQAVLEAAGGTVITLEGAPLRYGKPGFANPDFVARGRG